MLKQKPTLNHADVQLLIEMMKLHFMTQDQFTQFRSDMMDKFDIVIGYAKPTHDELLITQSVVTDHTERLDRIDTVLNLPPLTSLKKKKHIQSIKKSRDEFKSGSTLSHSEVFGNL